MFLAAPKKTKKHRKVDRSKSTYYRCPSCPPASDFSTEPGEGYQGDFLCDIRPYFPTVKEGSTEIDFSMPRTSFVIEILKKKGEAVTTQSRNKISNKISAEVRKFNQHFKVATNGCKGNLPPCFTDARKKETKSEAKPDNLPPPSVDPDTKLVPV